MSCRGPLPQHWDIYQSTAVRWTVALERCDATTGEPVTYDLTGLGAGFTLQLFADGAEVDTGTVTISDEAEGLLTLTIDAATTATLRSRSRGEWRLRMTTTALPDPEQIAHGTYAVRP